MVNKVVSTIDEAIVGFKDGITVMAGGFGLCGIPENLIKAVADRGFNKLTVISNNAGVDGFGLGLWLANKQIKTMIGSYVGENDLLEKMALDGSIDLQLVPQGTLAERIRAGAAGIPAFYTPTGVGTQVAEGKETRKFGNITAVLEYGMTADFALIRAKAADPYGNLVFDKTAMNFNPMMAQAGSITVVEVEEIVGVGDLDPNHVHVPGVYVDRVVKGTFEKRIERVTTRAA